MVRVAQLNAGVKIRSGKKLHYVVTSFLLFCYAIFTLWMERSSIQALYSFGNDDSDFGRYHSLSETPIADFQKTDDVCRIFSMSTSSSVNGDECRGSMKNSIDSHSNKTSCITGDPFRIRTTPSIVWEQRLSQILEASLFPSWHATHPKFAPWLRHMMQYYTPAQLRRSTAHSANPASAQRLLDILSKRYVALLQLDERKRQPQTNGSTTITSTESDLPEPLRIMVTGGSVTEGQDCHKNPIQLRRKLPGDMCAWPYRLEYMFNRGLFQGLPVVQVINLGTGGVNAEMAAITMEYRLMPNPDQLPHVVIYDHAANDARQADIEECAQIHLQRYIMAAHDLRPCDDDLPMVVLAEGLFTTEAGDGRAGMYGIPRNWATRLHSAANWYDLMAINYPNVIRNTLIPNLENTRFVEQFVGGEFVLHMGTGYHIGMAWTILFNFIAAWTETCNDRRFPGVLPSDNQQESSTVVSLSSKYIGPYESDGQFVDITREWKRKSEESKRICQDPTTMAIEAQNAPKCTYAWMAIPTTGIVNPRDIERVLRPVLKNIDGWKALGYPVEPKTGWYAQQANAAFALEFHPTIPTKYLTVMSMRSYGPKFVGTVLELTLQVVKNAGGEEDVLQQTFQIDPYHTVETSIHVPHKFELPGGMATVGDIITIEARLIRGAYFKIQGLALCRH